MQNPREWDLTYPEWEGVSGQQPLRATPSFRPSGQLLAWHGVTKTLVGIRAGGGRREKGEGNHCYKLSFSCRAWVNLPRVSVWIRLSHCYDHNPLPAPSSHVSILFPGKNSLHRCRRVHAQWLIRNNAPAYRSLVLDAIFLEADFDFIHFHYVWTKIGVPWWRRRCLCCDKENYVKIKKLSKK